MSWLIVVVRNRAVLALTSALVTLGATSEAAQNVAQAVVQAAIKLFGL